MNRKPHIFTLLTAAFALTLGLTGTAVAHGPNTLSDRGYDQMSQLAHELDEQAQHANDQAQHQGVWFYAHDARFIRAIANFADRASRFHERMDTYRSAPWQVDDELRLLLRDGQAVQYRLRRSRNADRHTVDDWNRTVALLNQMIRVYQRDIDLNQDEDSGYYPDNRSSDRYEAGRPTGRVVDSSQLAPLAHELAERSARLADLTRQFGDRYRNDDRRNTSIDAIQHFAQQADAFHERFERGLSSDDLRGNIDHLWQDGREADRQFQQANVPELRNEWTGMMQLLSRIRAAGGF
ncbi:MAG: hypothetical protein M3167_08605 [Acidobacteriota bacterium]|nr:hypothetical protein [Acidobacteriota bacterium]